MILKRRTRSYNHATTDMYIQLVHPRFDRRQSGNLFNTTLYTVTYAKFVIMKSAN